MKAGGPLKTRSETTHLVTRVDADGRLEKRTLNFYHAILRGLWVVSTGWVEDSMRSGAWLPEDQYEVKVRSSNCKTWGAFCRFADSRPCSGCLLISPACHSNQCWVKPLASSLSFLFSSDPPPPPPGRGSSFSPVQCRLLSSPLPFLLLPFTEAAGCAAGGCYWSPLG
jgi:hypothetical protein